MVNFRDWSVRIKSNYSRQFGVPAIGGPSTLILQSDPGGNVLLKETPIFGSAMNNRHLQLLAVLISLISLWPVPPAKAADNREFLITTTAPPTPALKFKLMFAVNERQPGNAALFYMQATMFINDNVDKDVDKATNARDSRDDPTFKKIMASYVDSFIMQKIESGAICQQCDWQPEIRQHGINALLPYLNHARELANIVSLVAEYQIRTGPAENAVPTLRAGYELGRNVQSDPILISGLVGRKLAGVGIVLLGLGEIGGTLFPGEARGGGGAVFARGRVGNRSGFGCIVENCLPVISGKIVGAGVGELVE